MKKRTVQLSLIAISLCLLLAITLIPSIAFTQDDSFTITENVIANEKTVWRYLDNNTDPAANYDSLDAWTRKDFDDSGWKSGAGYFGNKSGKLQTIFLGTASGFNTNVLIDLNDGTSDAENYKNGNHSDEACNFRENKIIGRVYSHNLKRINLLCYAHSSNLRRNI